MDIKLINNNMIKFLDLQKVTSKYADEIHNAVNRVVDSGWYLQGKENEKFEENYSHYIGVKHTIGCANGLDALIWILRAYVERSDNGSSVVNNRLKVQMLPGRILPIKMKKRIRITSKTIASKLSLPNPERNIMK